MEWVVSAADKGGCYLYGPFPTMAEAIVWKEKMKNEFFGRVVHVIRHETINPVID